MKIYTSYYARMKNLFSKYTVVAISTSVPEWFPNAYTLRELCPGWDLVNGIKSGSITKEEYTEKYKLKLSMYNPKEVRSTLRGIYQETGKDIVLCCYERPEDFCHRHIVAEWLGPDVKELEVTE